MNDDETRAPARRARRHDPERRSRIIDACLDVIARDGVAGTSHRKVAAAAGVPLGSMTYHFAGMDELLHEAFARFGQGISDEFERRMAQATDVAAARAAVADFIIDEGDDGGRGLVLSHELYTLAAREPGFRDLTTAWMERSRAALERHFDPVTARMVDAVIEGFTIHRALDSHDRDPNEVVQALERITAG